MIMPGYIFQEVRHAWQIARQVRGCPPDELVLAESPGQNLLAHLEVCTFCHDLRRTGKSYNEEFALPRHLAAIFELKVGEPIEEAQVRSMKESLAGWGPKKLFYNPPLVLILNRTKIHGDAVKVAQVYDDPRLSGPGDVEIGAGLFAETWNTYTLRASYLDRLIAKVPDDILKTISEQETGEAPRLNQHTALKAFRRLEVEVGAFFSMRAVSELMSQRQPDLAKVLSATFPSEHALFEQIRRRHPSITWPRPKFSVLEALALARFPDDEVPLAAAAEQKTVSVNVLRILPEAGTVDLSPSIAAISVWREYKSGFLVGGQISGKLMAEAELVARLELPDDSVIEPEETVIAAESGHFRVFFPTPGAAVRHDCRILLLVLTR
jgi:hypothetical protein